MSNLDNDPGGTRKSETSGDEFDELVRRGRAGDQEAIGLLLSKYRNYLLLIANQDLDNTLRAKLGASDVVQQSMMLAQQNFEQYRGATESEFLGWLRTILINDIRNNRRQFATKKRDAGLETNMQDRSAIERGVVDPNLTPSSEAMKEERARLLASALSELPEDYRTVVELRNFEQLNFNEIGNRMNRSADAARKLWARAVEILQSRLSMASPDLITGQFRVDEIDD